ncbi:hypothetical protein FKP32DRAFT_1569626, partial [Trametes sanguinea]
MATDIQELSGENQQQFPRKDLEDAQRALDTAARLKSPGRAVERDVVNSIDTASNASSSYGLGILLDGVNALVDNLPPLVRALDAVAQVHPVLSVAVGAFKVVVELEVKRHDNDKKVNLLFLEMRNMMTVLLQLQKVRDNHVGRDGMTIGKRLEDIVRKAAQDIKECANACDAYSHKRLLAKVFKAPSWDATLKDYIQRFSDRKAEFTFAISFHTGIGVDRANDKLDVLMTKMDIVLEFFDKAAPREQHILAEVIRTAGGSDAVLTNKAVLEEIVAREQQLMAASTRFPQSGSERSSRWQDNTTRTPAAGASHYYYPRAAETRRSHYGPTPYSRPNRGGYGQSGEGYVPAYGQGSYYAPAQAQPTDGYPKPAGQAREEPSYVHYPPNYGAPADRRGYYSVPVAPYYSSGPGYVIPGPATGGYTAPHSYVPPQIDQQGYVVDGRQAMGANLELDLLVQDLAEEPAVVVRRNFMWFERRFALQQREMMREMRRVIAHESDRVITTVLAGPHERIIDRELYEIWRDMRWRGIVKARHLVLAIHDYYMQKLDDQQRAVASGVVSQRPVNEEDVWALRCLDLKNLQRIVEVLDYDASGFVTIQEVNQFTTSRPEGWSLLRWLAYWSIGWQVAMTDYKRKIHTLLARMREVLPSVRPQLPPHTPFPVPWHYLMTVEPVLLGITGSFRDDGANRALLGKFREFVDQQEALIRERLETAGYRLDTLDTLALVNGPMGCERNVFIILYSLLRRHYDIMRVGQKVYVHPEELTEAAASVVLLSDAFMFRAQDLAGLFIQRRLDVDVEMEDFACGMVRNQDVSGYMPDTVTLDLAQAGDVLDTETDSDGVSETILRYPPFCEDFYPQSDDRVQECGTDVTDALKPLLGVWGGVASVTRRIPESLETYRATFSYHFHPSPTDPNKLIAEPVNPRTYSYTRLTVTMECAGSEADTGPRTYRMTESWNSSTLLSAEYELLLHEDGTMLSGGLKDAYSPSSPTVIMKKGSPPQVVMFYPLPADIQGSRAKALWRFALDAVLYDVKRRALSWNFIKERRDVRSRYVSLLRALVSNVPLPYEDFREHELLYGRIPPADLHFYTHVVMEPERYPSHWILPRCRACSRILRPDAARLC